MSMMVPNLDLANHSFQSNADWEADFAKGTIALVATEDIAKGEPVCIDYGGDVDNNQLMRVFGFVVTGNPNDRLDFLLEQAQRQTADADFDDSHSISRSDQQRYYLLADPFLHSGGLDSIAEQMDLQSLVHNGQSIVSCYEDPVLSRKLSAVLSLPLYASDQHAMLAIEEDVGDEVPEPGVKLSCN